MTSRRSVLTQGAALLGATSTGLLHQSAQAQSGKIRVGLMLPYTGTFAQMGFTIERELRLREHARVGEKIQKELSGVMYEGAITHYEHGPFHVEYEDGDVERRVKGHLLRRHVRRAPPTAPAAPSMWPVMDFVDDTCVFFAASPNSPLIASVSHTSPIGVEVPWALM